MVNFVEMLFRCMKKYYWIGCSTNNHARQLTVLTNKKIVNQKNLLDFIYFDSEDDANCFYDKLIQFIQKEYPRAKQQKWYTLECDE